MNVSDWLGLGGLGVTIAGGFIAWLVRLERRFSKTLTREEHEHICIERNERVERKLDSIETGITGTHKRIDDLYRDLFGRNAR